MEQPQDDQKTKALWSLILGIVGLVAFLMPIVGGPIQILGLVLGFKSTGSSRRKLAFLGIILCFIGLVLTIANGAMALYTEATNAAALYNILMN